LVELSEKQKQIVYAENGSIYVKASAGSGKTRVLTERIRFLLGNTPKKILALTFTNKAGEEIKERLTNIADIEKRATVGTFHSFCQTILENHGHLLGLKKTPHIFEDIADRLELVEKAIQQTPSYAFNYKSLDNNRKKKFRSEVLDFVSKVKRELIPESDFMEHTQDENVVLLYQNYQDILRAQNAIDFDDLLKLAYDLLLNFPKIASLYRRSFYAICIDEAQDLNNAQYQFLLALVNGQFTNIMMVGDPNQSIFHFNGSSPDYMNKYFVDTFNPKHFTLDENYRSSKAVLSAANKIIPDAEDIRGIVKDGLFEVMSLKNTDEEAKWVVDKINALLKVGLHPDIEGQITCERIAVLARNKYVFSKLEKELGEAQLPFYYKMTPGMIQFESDIMKMFDLAVRVKLNPQDSLHKQRLCSKLKMNYSVVSNLDEFVLTVSDGLLKQLLQMIIDLKDDGSNIKKSLIFFRDHLNINNINEKNMIFNDINELLKHWQNYAKKTDNRTISQFKNAMALGQTHPLAQHEGITLSTVHTMKGQEFDIVFVIGLDEETFPDYRAIQSGGIEMTQEKNNLYVAFTRAKRILYATWPKQRKMPWGAFKQRKKSQFLEMFED